MVSLAQAFGLLLVLGVVGSIIIVQLRTGVAAYPSHVFERQQALELLRQIDLSERAKIYELGSGWGGLAFAVSRIYPNATIVGLEVSPVPFLVSWLMSLRFSNVSIRYGDFFKQDLHDADAVLNFLMQRPMPRLAKKLDRELRSGTPVLNIGFWFRRRTPALTKEQGVHCHIALYRWPAQIDAKEGSSL